MFRMTFAEPELKPWSARYRTGEMQNICQQLLCQLLAECSAPVISFVVQFQQGAVDSKAAATARNSSLQYNSAMLHDAHLQPELEHHGNVHALSWDRNTQALYKKVVQSHDCY